MSAESTIIARSAHRDGQSLRIIQYLGLVFLPLSLCTVCVPSCCPQSTNELTGQQSIFGMGFFSTNLAPGEQQKALFVVSGTWWWFLALSVPFTLTVLLVAVSPVVFLMYKTPSLSISRTTSRTLHFSRTDTLGVQWGSARYSLKQAERRRVSDRSDLEKLISYEMAPKSREHSSDDEEVPP